MTTDLKFYVNNWIFGNVSLEEVIQRASDLGFHGIELVGEPSMIKAKDVNQILKDTGMHVISICCMHPGPAKNDLRLLSHPDIKERRKAVSYVKACIDLAKETGARSVLVVPSLVGQPSPIVSYESDLHAAIEPLQTLAEYAGSLDVLLTIEPINRYEVGLINNTTQAINLAERVGHGACRIMGDTFHMQIEEADGIPSAIRRVGNYWLQHLHVADNTRQAPGMGTMNWLEILRALYDIEYEGGVSLEPLPSGASPYDVRTGHIPKEDLDAELRTGLKHLLDMKHLLLSDMH